MRKGLSLAALVVAALAVGGDGARVARAEAGDRRAAVVVDLGDGEVRSACVLFREESISGLDLLRTAAMDPVVHAYSGEGGAVCKLCGVGCDAGSSCLTCQSPKYWQYWRADGGTEPYRYSHAGAGSVRVTDGDVEGWRWGSGSTPPPFRSVQSVCDAGPVYRYEAPAAATTTTAASQQAAPTSTSSPLAPSAPSTSTRPGVAGRATPTTLARSSPADPTAAPVTTAAADTATTTSLAATAEDDDGPAGREVAAAGDDDGTRNGSSIPGLVAFAVLVAAIVGWTIRLRLARPTPFRRQ
ncbi:MAG TPA: hypothetical protein VF230_18425 [Acidimicrobiales bacterium]